MKRSIVFHLYCFIVFLSKDFAESIEEDDNEAHMKIVYLNDSKAVFISSKKVENKKDKDAPPQRFTNVDVKTCYKANDSKVKGISEDQVNFRLGEFWKFTHRIPYFMKKCQTEIQFVHLLLRSHLDDGARWTNHHDTYPSLPQVPIDHR